MYACLRLDKSTEGRAPSEHRAFGYAAGARGQARPAGEKEPRQGRLGKVGARKGPRPSARCYLEDVLQLPQHGVNFVVQQPAEFLLLRGQAAVSRSGPPPPTRPGACPRASPAPLAPLPSLPLRSP